MYKRGKDDTRSTLYHMEEGHKVLATLIVAWLAIIPIFIYMNTCLTCFDDGDFDPFKIANISKLEISVNNDESITYGQLYHQMHNYEKSSFDYRGEFLKDKHSVSGKFKVDTITQTDENTWNIVSVMNINNGRSTEITLTTHTQPTMEQSKIDSWVEISDAKLTNIVLNEAQCALIIEGDLL